MVLLKKSDLFSGKNKICKVKLESLEGKEIYLRPLSRAEINECEEIENKALGDYTTNETSKRRGRRQKPKSAIVTEGKVNIAKVTTAAFESEKHMIYLSMQNEKDTFNLTEDEIGDIDPPIFEELVLHVKEISGLNVTEDDIKEFPEDE